MSEQSKRSTKVITYAISVTTTVKELCKENPSRTRLLVKNTGSAIVYVLSAQSLKSTDGYPVAATTGEYENKSTTAAMWIVAASGTNDVRVEEDTD